MRNRQISTHPNDGVGPYIEKKVLGSLLHTPTISEIPPIRREFLTLPQARSALQKRPKWSEDLRGDLQMISTWSDGSGAGLLLSRDVPVGADARKTGDCWQVRSPAMSARGGVGRNRRHAGGVTWFSGDNGAAIVGALKLFEFPAILPYLLGAAAFTRCGLPTGGLCIS
jgi:hypothetical protein